MKKTIILLILIICCFLACSDDPPATTDDTPDPTITLTLDPQGKGYFQYDGVQYSYDGTVVEVKSGAYLYFYGTKVFFKEGVTGWTEENANTLKSETPVNSNMSVTFSTSFTNPITLTLNPEGKGYFKYREESYDTVGEYEVKPGVSLYYYSTSGLPERWFAASNWYTFNYSDGVFNTAPLTSDMTALCPILSH